MVKLRFKGVHDSRHMASTRLQLISDHLCYTSRANRRSRAVEIDRLEREARVMWPRRW